MQAAFAFGCWAAALLLGQIILPGWFGLAIFTVGLGATFPYLTAIVPAKMIYVLQNIFRGSAGEERAKIYRVIFAGFNFRFPWEVLSFQIDIRREEERVNSGEGGDGFDTFPSQDGALMQVKWRFSMRPRPTEEAILAYIASRKETIVAVAKAEVRKFLSDRFAKINSVKLIQTKTELSKKVARIFGGRSNISDIERRYGVEIDDPQLFDVDYDPDTQRNRATIAKAEAFNRAMAQLDPTLDPEACRETVLLLNKDIGKDIKEFGVSKGLGGIITEVARSFFSKKGVRRARKGGRK